MFNDKEVEKKVKYKLGLFGDKEIRNRRFTKSK